MVYNKVYAQIGEERHIVLDPINYQYDIKQILVLTGETVPDYYEADVCNVGDTATLTMVGTAADGVEIPDTFLQDGRNVLVYVVIPGSGGDVQTRYDITIPVDERAEREDIDPSEAEQQQIDSLVAALNSGVGRAETAATEAEGSASNAAGHATDAEAWAAGQRAGTDVGTEDPTYHNNAKYYAGMAEAAAEEAGQHEASWETWVQRAETAAGNAEGSATAAGQSKTDAEAAAQTATQKAAAADASATEAENSASEAAQTVDGGVGAINAARDGALTAIGQAGTTQVNAVNQAGAAQVTAVNQAGTTQVQAVENKGAEVLDSIPQDYSDLADDVDGLTRQLSDVEENQIPELKNAISDIKDEFGTSTGINIYDEEHNSEQGQSDQYLIGTVYLDGYVGDLVVSCKGSKAGYISNPVLYDASGNQISASFGSTISNSDNSRYGKPIAIPSGAVRFLFNYRIKDASDNPIVEEVMVSKGATVPDEYEAYHRYTVLVNSDYVGSDVVGDLADLTTTDKSNLVAAINEAAQSGGGGGTSDYTQLTNKPQINSVTLTGNKSLSDIGAIALPANPTSGQYLKWNGSAWIADDLPVYNGGVT